MASKMPVISEEPEVLIALAETSTTAGGSEVNAEALTEALSAIADETKILEAAAEKLDQLDKIEKAGEKTEPSGEKSPGEGVPKKPKTEVVEKKFQSYEAEMCDHLKTTAEKLTFLEARSMMQKALPHEIMRNVMQEWMSFDYELDPTHICRKLADVRISVHMRYSETGAKPEVVTAVWKVIHTEALRRVLMSAWGIENVKKRREHLRWYFHVVSALDKSEKDHTLNASERLVNEEMMRIIHMKEAELDDFEDENWVQLRKDPIMAAELVSIKQLRGWAKTVKENMMNTTFPEPAYMKDWE